MANKKINAHYDSVEKVIVIDDDNVQKGDYIDITHDSIANQIFKSQLTVEVKKQVISEYKDTEEYKKTIENYTNEISRLTKEKDKLNSDLSISKNQLIQENKNKETDIKNAVLQFENTKYKELEIKYTNLLNENSNIKNEIKKTADEAINKFKASDEYLNLKSNIAKLEKQNELLPSKIIEDFRSSPEYSELKAKAERRTKLNSKVLGEDLEKFCENEYNDKLQLFNNAKWAKTTKSIQGKKPDFIFTVYTDENKDVEIASIILEMKTAASNQSNNKIDQYLDTLETNRINFEAEFALLVTDLELDYENDFIFKKAAGKSSIFIVRPQYFTYVLILFKLIYEKSNEFMTWLKKGSIGKEKIANFIEDFKKFKEDLFTKSIKNIHENLKNIVDSAENIKKSADKILNSVSTITERHLKSTENKVNEYLKKIINKENNFDE